MKNLLRVTPPIAISILSSLVCLAAAQAPRDLRLETAEQARLPDGRTRWAVVIGVSKYKNAPPNAQLQFAHRDAEDFARFLRSPRGGGLTSSHLRLMTDENATVGSIRAALKNWLPRTTAPNDIVYLFFAGHGVVAEGDKGYFVAHDSDPQNLHATGISFDEVNQAVSGTVRAGSIVLLADACHVGAIGWASNPESPSRAQSALESIGRDRSVLKLLASRPSERSYEDRKWDGGHGIFSFALLRGLRGEAERERDGVITAAELIDYVSKLVPEQTGAQQNPRVAGNFDARIPLAVTLNPAPSTAPAAVSLNIQGPAGAAVYIDDQFHGSIRSSGELRVEHLTPGRRRLSLDVPGEDSFEQTLNLSSAQTTLDLNRAPEFSLARLEGLVRRGRILDSGGAWDLYRTLTFAAEYKALADALMVGGLENTGQACVNDYVQSTTGGLKRAMLLRAVDAYRHLRTFRPSDRAVVMKERFCQGRAEIAAGQFAAAVKSLQESLAIDPAFACAHNALGVAFARLNRPQEARAAFENAARLTPEWSLPFLQIAQQLVAAGNVAGAVPYLEKSVQYNPRSIQSHWNLLRAYRLTGHASGLEQQAKEMIALDPNYAPTYLELALHYEARREHVNAAQAFDTYLLLAPNYADSAQIRARAERSRGLATRQPPSLLRKQN